MDCEFIFTTVYELILVLREVRRYCEASLFIESGIFIYYTGFFVA